MSTPNKKGGTGTSSSSSSTPTKTLPSVTPKSGSSAAKKPADTKKSGSSSTPKLPAISPTKPAETSTTTTSETAKEVTVSESPLVAEVPAAAETTVETKPPEATAPVEPPPIINGNGNVVLIYEQYNEEFPIVNGSTTQENIDEVYCLSFVMPNCLVHLSKHKPVVKNKMESDGIFEDLFIKEEPRGTYQGLEASNTYYVYVEQEEAQLKRDQEMMKKIALTMEGGGAKTEGVSRDDGRAMESCSCIYGNPCVDEYGCKDWDNRYAVATKNGWKGF